MNITGIQNVAVGYQGMNTNTTGNNNTAVGYQSLLSTTTTSDNTAIGYNTLSVAIVDQLTAVGLVHCKIMMLVYKTLRLVIKE